jgi:CheY-like chemotaxis protein
MNNWKNAPIMYIEDDEDDQELFTNAIGTLKLTHPVVICRDGAEALKYLASEQPAPFLILCDVNMPKMDGFELRRRIYSNPELKQKSIPFLFYSTNADFEYVDLAYKLTVQGYFKKQIDQREMRNQIKMIIDFWTECKHPNNCH